MTGKAGIQERGTCDGNFALIALVAVAQPWVRHQTRSAQHLEADHHEHLVRAQDGALGNVTRRSVEGGGCPTNCLAHEHSEATLVLQVLSRLSMFPGMEATRLCCVLRVVLCCALTGIESEVSQPFWRGTRSC